MGIISGPAGETFKGYPLITISISRVHFPVNVHFHQHLGVLAVHVVHIFYQFIILVVAGLPDLVNQALLYVGYRFLRHQDSALIPASSRVIGISVAISIVANSTVAISTVTISTVAVPVSSAVSTGFSFFPAIVVAIPAVSVVAVISVIIFLFGICGSFGRAGCLCFCVVPTVRYNRQKLTHRFRAHLQQRDFGLRIFTIFIRCGIRLRIFFRCCSVRFAEQKSA